MRVATIASHLAAAASLLALAGSVSAAEIKVFISGGFSAAYDTLVPQFEQATGHKIVTERGPSMGDRVTPVYTWVLAPAPAFWPPGSGCCGKRGSRSRERTRSMMSGPFETS